MSVWIVLYYFILIWLKPDLGSWELRYRYTWRKTLATWPKNMEFTHISEEPVAKRWYQLQKNSDSTSPFFRMSLPRSWIFQQPFLNASENNRSISLSPQRLPPPLKNGSGIPQTPMNFSTICWYKDQLNLQNLQFWWLSSASKSSKCWKWLMKRLMKIKKSMSTTILLKGFSEKNRYPKIQRFRKSFTLQ